MISTQRRDVEPLETTCYADVEPREVKWLWRPFIPRGGLTLLTGDGGYGKSYICCRLAADLSAGRSLPGQGALPPQRVLMINAEDSMAVVVQPRLKAMGADLSLIHGCEQSFPLDETAARKILASVHKHDITMIFIDPLVSFMGGVMDMNQANQVRAILAQLSAIALSQDIAVVVVHHVNKGQAVGQHRTLGSVDFTNGVRSQLLVDRSQAGVHSLVHVKSNWSALGGRLAYSFNDRSLDWGGFTYGGDNGRRAPNPETTKRGVAQAFLKNVLREGKLPVTELIALAEDEGITQSALERAKENMAKSKYIRSIRDKDKWYWELLIEEHPPADGQTLFGLSMLTPEALRIVHEQQNS